MLAKCWSNLNEMDTVVRMSPEVPESWNQAEGSRHLMSQEKLLLFSTYRSKRLSFTNRIN